MKKLIIFSLAGVLMAGTVKITSPKAGEKWIIGWGPYEIRWEFYKFAQPSRINLEIFLNSCRIAPHVPLTHRSFLWIPWGGCVDEKGGTFRIKIQWKGGSAESDEFSLIPPPYRLMSLEPDRKIYTVGQNLKLRWKSLQGKGQIQLWDWNRKLCDLGEISLSEGAYSWKVKNRCGTHLTGKFVFFRIASGEKTLFVSHIFKITGEMPPARRIR